MLRLLCDQNLNDDIVRGLLRRRPDPDLVRTRDVGLDSADDPAILDWSASNDRIVVTHDRATMPSFAYERVAAGLTMPGVFILDDRIAPGLAIDDLLLLDEFSLQTEWTDRVVYLPL